MGAGGGHRVGVGVGAVNRRPPGVVIPPPPPGCGDRKRPARILRELISRGARRRQQLVVAEFGAQTSGSAEHMANTFAVACCLDHLQARGLAHEIAPHVWQATSRAVR